MDVKVPNNLVFSIRYRLVYLIATLNPCRSRRPPPQGRKNPVWLSVYENRGVEINSLGCFSRAVKSRSIDAGDRITQILAKTLYSNEVRTGRIAWFSGDRYRLLQLGRDRWDGNPSQRRSSWIPGRGRWPSPQVRCTQSEECHEA